MSRLLYQAELPRQVTARFSRGYRAPCQNRTDDLFLTKEVRYHCAKGAGTCPDSLSIKGWIGEIEPDKPKAPVSRKKPALVGGR